MRSVHILYDFFYDFDKNKVTLGGIQTYINDLISVCKSISLSVYVYQMKGPNKELVLDGVSIKSLSINTGKYQELTNAVLQLIDNDNSLVIYATDSLVPAKNPFKHTVALQHGINWDMPRAKSRNLFLMQLLKARRNYSIIRKVNNVDTVVCVDYNFVNWLRAQVDRIDNKMEVVPNYTRIAEPWAKPAGSINIIFARRLWWYRGTRVFTEAITHILNDYKGVQVTVAGTGPDEQYMHEHLEKYPNVKFITYKSSESLNIHKDKHIAIVPTVGSEGTSLSLLEAMSAQCAVIASNVGGMTNIILDGYNGLMVNSGDADNLYQAIKKLIDNPSMIESLSSKGYETAKQSFSFDKWSDRWVEILKERI